MAHIPSTSKGVQPKGSAAVQSPAFPTLKGAYSAGTPPKSVRSGKSRSAMAKR